MDTDEEDVRNNSGSLLSELKQAIGSFQADTEAILQVHNLQQGQYIDTTANNNHI